MLKIMSDFEQDLMTNEHVGSQLYTCMIFICLGYSSRKKNILIGGGLRTYLFKIPGLELLGIWRIWRILTRALENPKNVHFNKLLLTKVCNAWAKKSIKELCLMALKLVQNLKETGLCFLKIFVFWLKNSDFIL